MLTQKGIDRIRNRLSKATLGPWKWTSFGRVPQLEGKNEYAEMNPVLVARGCGNTHEHSDCLVIGCMPEKLEDPLRACPLHPDAEDRDFIEHAYDDIQSLLDYITTIESKKDDD